MLIGVGLHAGQNSIKTSDARMLLTLGEFTSFRDEVYWSAVEQSSGVFDVPYSSSSADRLFRDVPNGLLILDYGNSLYGGGFPTTSAAIEAFARYAAWMAQRYGGRVWGFEIWNEANIGLGNSGTDVTPAQYVALVEAVYPVLRQYAPAARIVAGAVTGIDIGSDWLEEAFQLGLLNYCDTISLHPYSWGFGSGAHAAYAFAWVDEVRALVETYNVSNPQSIVVTEIGWPNHTGTHSTTEEETAGYLVQTLMLAKARSWMDGVWWYEMVNQGTDAEATEDNYGLVTSTYAAKPAMLAVKKVGPLVGPSTFVDGGVLATARHWYTVELEDGDEMTAVWVGAVSGSASFTIASSDSFASAELVYGTDPTFAGSSITPTIGEDPIVFRHAAGTVTVT